MARFKKYLDIDVLTAARQRIAHLYDLYDVVVVCFSGGKDSLVVLLLAWEEAKRRGDKTLRVIFRDEELIPDEVINFVNGYRLADWVDMDWYAVPMRGQKFILGKSTEYLQWVMYAEPSGHTLRHTLRHTPPCPRHTP